MKSPTRLLLSLVALSAVLGLALAQEAPKPEKLKILLIAGGCCHDYETQTKLLKAGIEERLDATVTVDLNPGKGTDVTFPSYEKDDWAEGYDLVIHDECAANVTDPVYVQRILNAHKAGTPAVNLHCAMHSYRWGNFKEAVEPGGDNAGWYEFIGIQSTSHGPQSPIEVKFTDAQSPIIAGLEDWTTINEELYNNVQVFPGTVALAVGHQLQTPRKKDLKNNPDAQPKKSEAVVIWTNEYGPNKTRVFSTSLGHNNVTVADERYLEMLKRGILWSTGNL